MEPSTQAVPFIATTFLVILLLAPASEAAISCSDVIRDMRPCVSYLQGGGGKPPQACCDGAKTLASAAATKADRQTTCNCLKSASKGMNVNPGLVKALPGNCGINLGFSIDPSTDCSTIS
ncbi:hypothetical protein NMG60_11023282 [Bertholletia excelsa]